MHAERCERQSVCLSVRSRCPLVIPDGRASAPAPTRPHCFRTRCQGFLRFPPSSIVPCKRGEESLPPPPFTSPSSTVPSPGSALAHPSLHPASAPLPPSALPDDNSETSVSRLQHKASFLSLQPPWRLAPTPITQTDGANPDPSARPRGRQKNQRLTRGEEEEQEERRRSTQEEDCFVTAATRRPSAQTARPSGASARGRKIPQQKHQDGLVFVPLWCLE